MTTNDKTAEKRTAVDYLSFGAKTARRVNWEAFEFEIEAPHLIRVTNASYGYLAGEHSYLVGVDDRNGIAIPSECECKADLYNEDYACKHRVACAIVGGETLLNAAVAFSPPSTPSGETKSETVAEKRKANSGEPATCPNGALYCDGPEGDDLPCFDCFQGEEA
jgi:hypothetical protein